jgi:hypothetical protein
MAPILKFATSSGSKKKEPRYACQKNPSKSLVRIPPPCSPSRVPTDRDAPSPEPVVYSFIYICCNPQKRAVHEMGGKHMVTIHGAPHEWKVYMQWGAAWFPKGIVNDTAITTPVPWRLQHDTFHLGLGRPEPR